MILPLNNVYGLTSPSAGGSWWQDYDCCKITPGACHAEWTKGNEKSTSLCPCAIAQVTTYYSSIHRLVRHMGRSAIWWNLVMLRKLLKLIWLRWKSVLQYNPNHPLLQYSIPSPCHRLPPFRKLFPKTMPWDCFSAGGSQWRVVGVVDQR